MGSEGSSRVVGCPSRRRDLRRRRSQAPDKLKMIEDSAAVDPPPANSTPLEKMTKNRAWGIPMPE
ncbi:hypothetical protein CASFOL_004358 [Castilleja foliolosa]|uniref:Uncharacterized protein n=1 Tax=Castilleja foliolosa TaxID=1961234 RepID=A0ABD3EDY1_9LAMI